MENHHAINGEINDFYGHFQVRKPLVYQMVNHFHIKNGYGSKVPQSLDGEDRVVELKSVVPQDFYCPYPNDEKP